MISSIMSFFKKNYVEIILIFVIIFGFAYRIYGLKANYSLWVDEASTARFGRGVLETGLPKIKLTGYSDNAYYTTAYLTGAAFKIFGINESASRLPEVIFGTLVILAVYWLGKEIFNKYIGLGASLFTAFSYIQIAWSRQARGYVILEFFFLLTLLFLWRFSKKGDIKSLVFLLASLILSLLTHYLGLILVPIILIFLVIYNRRLFLSKIFPWLLISIFLIAFIFFDWRFLFTFIFKNVLPNFTKNNFILYYHSLFWRQYPLFVFLSLISVLSLFFQKQKKIAVFFLISLFCYLFVVTFVIPVPFEKYALVVFPVLFVFSSFSLSEIAKFLTKRKNLQIFLFAFLVGFILVNGNKFSLKPRSFYTLNFDMREIPEIDYKELYSLMKNKVSGINFDKIAFVDIDADATAWYLGEGVKGFVPRNDANDFIVDKNHNYIYLHSLEEFKQVEEDIPYGFVSLIEHNYRFYPDGFVDYVRKNLTLEKREEFAPFSPDWNRWPVELYSWGFEKNAKD